VAVEFAPALGAKGQLTGTLNYGFTYGPNRGNVAVMLKGKVK
jgi:hypothetical protein